MPSFDVLAFRTNVYSTRGSNRSKDWPQRPDPWPLCLSLSLTLWHFYGSLDLLQADPMTLDVKWGYLSRWRGGREQLLRPLPPGRRERGGRICSTHSPGRVPWGRICELINERKTLCHWVNFNEQYSLYIYIYNVFTSLFYSISTCFIYSKDMINNLLHYYA